MFDKFKSLFNVYRAGQSVADAVFLKKSQITVSIIAVFLTAAVAAIRSFGYDLLITDGQLDQIAGTLFIFVGLFNAHATVASTTKFGLPPLPGPTSTVDSTSSMGMPNVEKVSAPTMPRQRRAANGEVLNDLDNNHI